MDALYALLLGIVQGLTEWLPVSSSGHLVIFQELFGLEPDENLVFDLVVHLGTIMTVCVYFRKELWNIVRSVFVRKADRDAEVDKLRKLGFMLLLGTVPVAVVGVLLTSVVDEIFDITLVGLALIANAAMLLVVERYRAGGSKKSPSVKDSIVIGSFQAVSILPGISRSGSTISGGMVVGLERETAAVFAFLLSVPALAGAFAYGVLTLDSFDLDATSALVGFAAAFLTGIASIKVLLRAVRSQQLWMFAAYCAIVGTAVLLTTA
ncbi:MAG TPA: undecaprenyl-diphosphate phosphatase [Thermoplasmata archaeon]